MNVHQVLLRPTITEKSTLLQESGKYTFRVASRANKVQVKEAVETSFNVTVLDVNITKTHGKRKRYGSRITKKPDIKKAVVTLASGDRIELVEGL
ncbi:MAG TPA: 50S ribosomal protein L23 [Dehalococcoidia bacterium]|jgi:large subunit ribosomal protein L23|nr:50S ribosomal protein L23 [Dehalococcoidia bacterium]